MSHSSLSLTGQRFIVEYLLQGTEAQARRAAELLCLDQTIEAPEEILPETPIGTDILGRIEQFTTMQADRHQVVISYPVELFGSTCTQLLHTLFGTVSMKPGIRLMRLNLPDTLPEGWPGPRFGQTGVRVLVDIPQRPLVCVVLKPLSLSPQALADLAYQFAVGGVDLIKDDQGLADHPFCPFAERVKRCAEAVARANRETGKTCLYVPHVSGPWELLHSQCLLAEQAGAGGLLICPGLTGYDALREIARDDAIALPIMSHPAMLGSYYVSPTSGITPSVLFGQLPRLVGADITIFPTYGLEFPISREDCLAIATACRAQWGPLKPTLPTAAGRMWLGRVEEMHKDFGPEVVFILGSQVQREPDGFVQACQRFLSEVERHAR